MRKSKARTTIFIILVLMIIISSYLALADLSGSDICIINTNGSKSDCSPVQDSKYGEFLGIKVVWYGRTGFIILFLLYFLNHKQNDRTYHKAYLVLTITGALFAIYFISLQLFILKTICANCMIIDSLMILVTILSLIEYKQTAPVV